MNSEWGKYYKGYEDIIQVRERLCLLSIKKVNYVVSHETLKPHSFHFYFTNYLMGHWLLVVLILQKRPGQVLRVEQYVWRYTQNAAQYKGHRMGVAGVSRGSGSGPSQGLSLTRFIQGIFKFKDSLILKNLDLLLRSLFRYNIYK